MAGMWTLVSAWLLLLGACRGQQVQDAQVRTHLADVVAMLSSLAADREQTSQQVRRIELLIRCKPPVVQDHGSVEERVVGDQLVLSFSCKEQYRLQGEDTLACHRGVWNGSFPSCTAICQVPVKLTSEVSLRKEQEDGGVEVHFTCPEETVLHGSDVLVCNKAGWNASFPCCYTFKVGDQIKVKASVSSPLYNWGKASPDSVGPITKVETDKLLVDFPEQAGWMAAKDEMELIDPPDDCQGIIP